VVRAPFAWYREYVPCEALRADVYALFSFVPGRMLVSASRALVREVAFRHPIVSAPQFADGQVSIVFEVGQSCSVDGHWRTDSNAVGETVIGPMSSVGRSAGLNYSETVGAYFRPGRASRFFDIPSSDLADTAVAVADIWGTPDTELSGQLADQNEAGRLEGVESLLLARARERRPRTGFLDVEGLAASVLRTPGRATVDGMARAAGVSRQHLSREFRDRIGTGPKLYCRLARFHALLEYASSRQTVDWARVALEVGFSDQSHMIAECRRFSGLTPQALANRDWFHPFIERAKARR
jgi:AraC-like DNA-binding protein